MPRTLVDADGRSVKLLRALGKGGFGSVWQAEVTSKAGLVHHMAIKLLHEELMTDDDLVARARDEARLMSQLNHDHVVKIHALTRLEGRAAVLMEYVEGIDCTALLNAARQQGEPGLPMTVGLAIIERSAAALDAAWNSISPQTGRPLHVVHRDIKPSNLLVSVTGQVKVMDFGVARADFDREAQTQSVQFGTQRFMAPERWLRGVAGPESDVFSLGVTLWELLVGAKFERLPLSEIHYEEKRREQVRALEYRTPLDPAGLGAAQQLLGEMLAFDPQKRPTAAEVEERTSDLLDRTRGPDLRRWARKTVPALVAARTEQLETDPDIAELSGTLSRRVEPEETAPERTPPTLAPAPEAGPEPDLTPAPATPTWAPDPQPPSRSPLYAGVGLGLAAVLLVGGGLAWLWQPGDSPADTGMTGATPEPVAVAEPDALPEPAVLDEPEPEEPEVVPPKRAARTVADVPAEDASEPPATEEPQTEDAAEPTPVTTVVRVTERPAEPETVQVKVLADPSDGYVQVGGTRVPVRQTLTLPVGETADMTFHWPDAQTVRCQKQITADLTKIKFEQGADRCSYSF